jgi:hypothetical protein
MVMVGEEWPRISATTFGLSPAASMRDAAVWRVSCKRMMRNSDFVAS